jgi:hypothetical protein
LGFQFHVFLSGELSSKNFDNHPQKNTDESHTDEAEEKSKDEVHVEYEFHFSSIFLLELGTKRLVERLTGTDLPIGRIEVPEAIKKKILFSKNK